MNSIADHTDGFIADFEAWARSRTAAMPQCPPPPLPPTWGAEHVAFRGEHGQSVAAPAAPWDRCPHCRGCGATFAADEGGYDRAHDCRCLHLRRACEAYTRAGVPVVRGAAGVGLDGLDWSRYVDGDKLRRALLEWARSALDVGDGPPILTLCGPSGVGKTHMAAGLLRRACLVRPALRPCWLSWSGLLDAHGSRENMGDEEKRKVAAIRERLDGSRSAVVDELTQRGGEWGVRELERMVSASADTRSPLVLTANLLPVELRMAFGDRVWSRLNGDGRVLEVVSADARIRGEA